jgi:hypothetical protein
MNMRVSRSWPVLTLPVLVGTLTNGCDGRLLSNKVTEGTITYTLSFPEYDPNGLMANMLPEKTTLSFSNGFQVAELSAGMGVFKTSMVANNEEKELDYHLSVMSKKMVASLHPRDLYLFNSDCEPVTILYSDQVDTLLGYPCKKATALYAGIDQPEIEIWYTEAIDVPDANWFGPFSEVPGVLLRYELVQYGMRMRLNATEVRPGPVDTSKFATRQDFQRVSPEVLHHELNEVLGAFSM